MAIKTALLLVFATVVASAENLRVDLPAGTVSDFESLAVSLGLSTEAQHGRELGPFCDTVIERILDLVPAEILPDFEFECGCSINFRKRYIDFDCELIDPFCVGKDDMELCIAGHAQANLTFAEEVALEVDLCADIEASVSLPELPIEVPDITLPETCVALKTCEGQGLRGLMSFCECSVMMGDEECTSCTVCEDGKSVSLDCTEINEMFAFECIGLDTFRPADMQ